jgi:hypothetical protein
VPATPTSDRECLACSGSDRRDPRVRDLVRRGVIVGFWRSGSAEA